MLTLDTAPPASHANADAYDLMGSAAARAVEMKRGNILFPTVAEGYSPLAIRIVEAATESALGCDDVREYRTEPGERIGVDMTDVFFGVAMLPDDPPVEEMFAAIRQALRWMEFEGHEDPEGDTAVIEVRRNKLGWGGVAKHTTRPYAALVHGVFLEDAAGRTRTFATRAAAEKAAGLALAWSHGKGDR